VVHTGVHYKLFETEARHKQNKIKLPRCISHKQNKIKVPRCISISLYDFDSIEEKQDAHIIHKDRNLKSTSRNYDTRIYKWKWI